MLYHATQTCVLDRWGGLDGSKRVDVFWRMLNHKTQTWPGLVFSIMGAVLMVTPLGVRPLRRHEFRKLWWQLWMACFLCDLLIVSLADGR